MSGEYNVGVSMIAAFSGAASEGISGEVLQKMAANGLYVWIDFCCVPQIVRREDDESSGGFSQGSNSKVHKVQPSTGYYDQDAKDLQAAVRSIPAYVERCALFLALVPPLDHSVRTGECCDLTIWQSRGWCRLEILARWIARDSTQSVIVAESATNVTVKAVQVPARSRKIKNTC